ncbi:hypothetical protein OKA05_06345 [Luteolibacter arcticus]|uniref:Uncharacterized protein n=1 Tax=Luteolibacter arcticus TaxID=1581411 RepID=A0ABT3GGL8_9BACT|nr:hypothetical protein [Luteolibacter arcticus]MCW1922164.1 hypothetical protein [Luteolibacter arcticus]
MISQKKPREKSLKKRNYVKKDPHILTIEDLPKIVDSIIKINTEAKRESRKFWLGFLCLVATLSLYAFGGAAAYGVVLMTPVVAYLSRN